MGNEPTADRLILASASKGRRWLLEQAGYAFEVMPSGIDEPTGEGAPEPRGLVQQIAWLKAAAVAPRVGAGLILAADSLAWHRGKPIGKPADRDDARRIITSLAGTTHELWTGVCLWRRPSDWQIAWQESSTVSFAPLTEAEIEAYLDTREWEGCSGAYSIKGADDPWVRVVEGTESNVIGLPMETLAAVLQWAGVRLVGPRSA